MAKLWNTPPTNLPSEALAKDGRLQDKPRVPADRKQEYFACD
jgi:hypothetical protein